MSWLRVHRQRLVLSFPQEFGQTLSEEEDGLFQSLFDFDDTAMADAASENGIKMINYSRADEHWASSFDQFWEERAPKIMESVRAQGEKLLPGAGLGRAGDFFEHMALDYLRPEEVDKTRILNAETADPEILFLQQPIRQVVQVVRIKAATMRAVALYFVQKTCYLMVEGLRCAHKTIAKKQDMRVLIEVLGGHDTVFQELRRGFLDQLLVHADNAFHQSISDHENWLSSIGAMRTVEHGLLSQGSAPHHLTCSQAVNLALKDRGKPNWGATRVVLKMNQINNQHARNKS